MISIKRKIPTTDSTIKTETTVKERKLEYGFTGTSEVANSNDLLSNKLNFDNNTILSETFTAPKEIDSSDSSKYFQNTTQAIGTEVMENLISAKPIEDNIEKLRLAFVRNRSSKKIGRLFRDHRRSLLVKPSNKRHFVKKQFRISKNNTSFNTFYFKGIKYGGKFYATLHGLRVPPQIAHDEGTSGGFIQETYKDKIFLGLTPSQRSIESGNTIKGTSEKGLNAIEGLKCFQPNYLVEDDLIMTRNRGLNLWDYYHANPGSVTIKDLENPYKDMRTLHSRQFYHLDFKTHNLTVEEKTGKLKIIIKKIIIIDLATLTSRDEVPNHRLTEGFVTEKLSSIISFKEYHIHSIIELTGINLNTGKHLYDKNDSNIQFIRRRYSYVDQNLFEQLPPKFTSAEFLSTMNGLAYNHYNYEDNSFFIEDYHLNRLSEITDCDIRSFNSFRKGDMIVRSIYDNYSYCNAELLVKLFIEVGDGTFNLKQLLSTMDNPRYSDIIDLADYLQAADEFGMAMVAMHIDRVYRPTKQIVGVEITPIIEKWIKNKVKDDYQEDFEILITDPVFYTQQFYSSDRKDTPRVHVTNMIKFN